MDKKIFIGMPLGAIALLLLAIVFDIVMDCKVDNISKVILIGAMALVFLALKSKESKAEQLDDFALTDAEEVASFEIEVDHEKMDKLLKDSLTARISVFAKDKLTLQNTGNGLVRKQIKLFSFNKEVKKNDVEALCERISATHTTWEDLLSLHDIHDIETKAMIVGFATTGVAKDTGLNMVACLKGANHAKLCATFLNGRFPAGTLFPLVVEASEID